MNKGVIMLSHEQFSRTDRERPIKETSTSLRRRLQLNGCRCAFVCALAIWTFIGSSASAATFSANTFIGISDTTYDSQDIEVTNCTVTIDGIHNFSSLHIENGGIVTHSFASNGFLLNPVHATNEFQVMSD